MKNIETCKTCKHRRRWQKARLDGKRDNYYICNCPEAEAYMFEVPPDECCVDWEEKD